MFEFMTVIKAISDLNRVRILSVLNGHELCVCQIIKLLKLAPSTVSKHLSILRHAHLIEDRKDGRWMYYRLPNKPSILTKRVLELINESLASEKQICDDFKIVSEIQAMSKAELSENCR